MLSVIASAGLSGLKADPVQVEVDVAAQGLPSTIIVGLASKAVDEARQRVRAAIKNAGLEYPSKRITVNLAPADVPKDAAIYDVPIALGILISSEQLGLTGIEDAVFVGELSLDGTVRAVTGILSITLMARSSGFKRIFVPEVNAREAALIEDIQVFPVKRLAQLVAHLNSGKVIKPQPVTTIDQSFDLEQIVDFGSINGQDFAKEAMIIAAAGRHNIFMSGPPGSGKTLLARALPGILPPLNKARALTVTRLYSIAGQLDADLGVLTQPPFRAPHHTTSRYGLIGGGSKPLPGEISLAHHGVLFLDELPEFPRSVLESLRQPIEDGQVHISRVKGSVTYPSQVMLVAAANPCPCGYHGTETKTCNCNPYLIERYQKKMSGPLLDRIDVHVQVAPVDLAKITRSRSKRSSEEIRRRVIQARQFSEQRLEKIELPTKQIPNKDLLELLQVETKAVALLEKYAVKNFLSARAFSKIISVARTIADLQADAMVKSEHIAHALQYRRRED